MMEIETDSEEESAGGAVLIFNQNTGMLELTSLTFLTFFVSAYQHTVNHGARTVASSETSAG